MLLSQKLMLTKTVKTKRFMVSSCVVRDCNSNVNPKIVFYN